MVWFIAFALLALYGLVGLFFYVVFSVKAKLTDAYVPDDLSFDSSDFKSAATCSLFFWPIVSVLMSLTLVVRVFRVFFLLIVPVWRRSVGRLVDAITESIETRQERQRLRIIEEEEARLNAPVKLTHSYRELADDGSKKHGTNGFGSF